MASAPGVDWRAGDGIVLRTPLLPVTMLEAWAAAPDPRAYLRELLDLPEVREAIFVASPSLHDALDLWRSAPESAAGQRAERSLVKYAARMAMRATPFGLFSGVSTAQLGRETRLELAPRAEYRRRTRLDNDYLFALADALARMPAIRPRLTYRPNTSLYRTGERLRYVMARLEGTERRYELVAATSSPYLEVTLARAQKGAQMDELAQALVDPEITLDESSAYIASLIDVQLLVPDLGVHVTGPEPIDGLIAQLEAAGVADARGVLEEVRAQLARLDAGGMGHPPDRYLAVAAHLEALPAKVERARLFQVDMLKPAKATIGARVAAELAKVIGALARITRPSALSSLSEFRRTFLERYGEREMPLAEVLDEESGIGFEVESGPGAEGSPLLAQLGFPAPLPDERAPWGRFERHMLRRLGDALASGREEIALDERDLDAMKVDRPAHLPDAFSAVARLAASGNDHPEILLEVTGGPSGARLLGRFCHASPEIEAMVRSHHALEEAHRPNAIFAEIVHLNEGRTGNVLCRPVLRSHELVYLGLSGAPEGARIHLDDLLVSVAGDRVVLRSRRLGSEVIPRLTTAHLFRLRGGLGVYRFLGAVAAQGLDNIGWSWGALEDAPFLPRVQLGRVIVSRATWNLAAQDLAPIVTAVRKGTGTTSAISTLRAARRLPRYVALVAGDNELPIDLDNPLLARVFADELTHNPTARITELFPTPERALAHGPEGRFANEVILTFTRTAHAEPASPRRMTSRLRRSFTPGSEWLYAKIYCGEATADRVLCEAVAPLVRAHGAPWFFIRYADPEPHLRLRLHGDPKRLAAETLPALEHLIAPLHAQGVVHRLVIDTYERELERYGGDRGVELVEHLFWRDSEAVLGIVERLDGNAGADARWRLALRGIETLLQTLGLDPAERAALFTSAREMLGREVHADADFWGRVGARFAKVRAELEVLFACDPTHDAMHVLAPGLMLLRERDAALVELAAELRRRDEAGALVPKLGDMAWSLVHMHANRLLHASQRAQELVLYDFLRRLHAARRARSGS